jgi:clan AA aspartic protease
MITGVILNNGTPVIELKVRGSRGEIPVEGILDTGFNGFLCLPISIAISLGLELIDATESELADGTVTQDDLVFAGQAEWDGTMRDVDILLTRSEETLIGTAFLTGYRVELDYSASTVRIERVP